MKEFEKLNGLSILTHYYKQGTLNIIAGVPGMGKTTFVVNLAVELNKPVAFFSLEMAESDLLRTKGFKQNDLIFIDDTPDLSMEECQQRCCKMKTAHNIQMVIVDYLDLLYKFSKKDIIKGLKSIADELQVPIVATAMAKRKTAIDKDKRPHIEDFYTWGGDKTLLDYCDDIRLLYRQNYYSPCNFHNPCGTLEVLPSEKNYGLNNNIILSYNMDRYPIFSEADFPIDR